MGFTDGFEKGSANSIWQLLLNFHNMEATSTNVPVVVVLLQTVVMLNATATSNYIATAIVTISYYCYWAFVSLKFIHFQQYPTQSKIIVVVWSENISSNIVVILLFLRPDKENVNSLCYAGGAH